MTNVNEYLKNKPAEMAVYNWLCTESQGCLDTDLDTDPACITPLYALVDAGYVQTEKVKNKTGQLVTRYFVKEN